MTDERTSWRAAALCIDTDPSIWFHERGHKGMIALAKRICEQCPVKEPCLDEALRDTWSDHLGIRGGMTPKDRRAVRRLRRRGEEGEVA